MSMFFYGLFPENTYLRTYLLEALRCAFQGDAALTSHYMDFVGHAWPNKKLPVIIDLQALPEGSVSTVKRSFQDLRIRLRPGGQETVELVFAETATEFRRLKRLYGRTLKALNEHRELSTSRA